MVVLKLDTYVYRGFGRTFGGGLFRNDKKTTEAGVCRKHMVCSILTC